MRQWHTDIRKLIEDIRAWPDWRQGALLDMRTGAAPAEQGRIALQAYAIYVRRFILIMCDVLAKCPDVDERFWRLADNLHDELGGSVGLKAAHTRLIADIGPELPGDNGSICEIRAIEEYMFHQFADLAWPLNLFALGPGTESVSDLFLDPLEKWCEQLLEDRPDLRVYFDVHRPAVEWEHQNALAEVLAGELERLPDREAQALFEIGSAVSWATCRRHHQAVALAHSAALVACNK